MSVDASQPIRVRMAPSPTGRLHIGTVRTALFNCLFARHYGGTMVVRIEDTDQARSRPEYTADILDGLTRLGITWDEGPGAGGEYGPYFQSQRMPLYHQALEQLLAEGKVYPCFCSAEELQAEREKAQAQNRDFVYSGKCRDLSPQSVQEQAGRKPVYRFRVPEKQLAFEDLIRGTVQFNTALIGDLIVAKADKTPVYNFAVVVDDIHMQITHVIRGEDHLSNTPKQILFYEALGRPTPYFAHTAMMLAPDRSKLSKRHGAVAVAEYLEQGYLPEALVNYLALLGWSPPDEKEVLSMEELSASFSIERVNKSGAVFDIEKLKWINGQWIRRLEPSILCDLLLPFWERANLEPGRHDRSWLEAVTTLIREKLTLLADAVPEAAFLLHDELAYVPEQVTPALQLPSAEPVLLAFLEQLAGLDWQLEGINLALEGLKGQLGFKPKEIMWPIRAAITGRTYGADLTRGIWLLGRQKSCQRLQALISFIKDA